ncbi:Phosphoribosylaminoimidazole-succinocarboxamide synthase [Candidatus Nitrosotalea sp. TS]|uniref:phosphoribosylaminoimidazolesuccinocarboxamide synthase n=1 Tax=Candidatus Nitrosotalea sp. TS TaxID=2341020 RepID=UPI00140CAFBA|nr:phosphoribosylaminoimidazolesuccinocarboxamide synthase [Candidatus Nitrosotalea sp. TS]NHI02624.1 Phosphoribosylaminoimidazole-succinocarboxamide synthase [Candidatus Nitrosotalea sp. TS]
MRFLRSGKVKDIYELDDKHVLFHFSDRVSAFDVKFPSPIPRKGEVLCKFAEFWFKNLPTKNHYVRTEAKDKIIVKKMDIIPIECVVRGYFYGSLIQRWKEGEVKIPEGTNTQIAAKFPTPIFDPTTKSETHDIPITREAALERNLASAADYDWLEKTSLGIYQNMSQIAEKAGFILADLKLEFGKIGDEIILGDSIGPDEYRMWPKESYQVGKIQESYDKQLLRDWLAARGLQKKFEDERKQGLDPVAPELPQDLCNEMSSRYLTSYERITGTRL